MGLFRRRSETLNEILMREAGLDPSGVQTRVAPARAPAPSRPAPSAAAPVEPMAMVATADAPAVGGHEAIFVALPDGSLIVETEQGDGDLAPIADAVERQLAAPYRARATRSGDARWNVAAQKIAVIEMNEAGDSIVLTSRAGALSATVDGQSVAAPFPNLELLGDRLGTSYVVRADRLDGDLWEVRTEPF
jgi:hypothetical protein